MATRMPARSPALPSAFWSADRASWVMRISPDRSGSRLHASTGFQRLQRSTQQVGGRFNGLNARVGELADALRRLGGKDANAQRAHVGGLTQDCQGPERVCVGDVVAAIHQPIE